jgi:hypothetical protein
MTHLGVIILVTHGLEHIRFFVMFTQLDDDGQKFVMVYVSQSNNKMKAKYNFYEKGCLILGHFIISMLFVW